MSTATKEKSASLAFTADMAKQALGPESDLEAVRRWILRNHPDVLLNDSRVQQAQRRAVATALKTPDASGLSKYYPTRAPGVYWPRSMFEASDYTVLGARLIVANRRNTHQLDKVLTEACERGYTVTFEDCSRMADEMWADHDPDAEQVA